MTLLERSSVPFLFVFLDFLLREKKEKKKKKRNKKEVQLRNIPNPQNRYCYPH